MSESEEIWAEIAELREELNALKIRREIILEHIEELRVLKHDIQQNADEAERLARKVEQALIDGGTAA